MKRTIASAMALVILTASLAYADQMPTQVQLLQTEDGALHMVVDGIRHSITPGQIPAQELAKYQEGEPFGLGLAPGSMMRTGGGPAWLPEWPPVTISGRYTMNSAAFNLPAGELVARWRATTPSKTGCFHGASLRGIDVPYVDSLGSGLLDPGWKELTGETWLYGIKVARYYVDAKSGCNWTDTISQN